MGNQSLKRDVPVIWGGVRIVGKERWMSSGTHKEAPMEARYDGSFSGGNRFRDDYVDGDLMRADLLVGCGYDVEVGELVWGRCGVGHGWIYLQSETTADEEICVDNWALD